MCVETIALYPEGYVQILKTGVFNNILNRVFLLYA